MDDSIIKKCPCCSGKKFSICCQSFINGQEFPATALQLMRSRYTAYSLAKIDYIQKTMCGSAAEGFDPIAAKQWAMTVKWCGLTILDKGLQKNTLTQDQVEFVARYLLQDHLHIIHERSQFEQHDGHWFYQTGEIIPEPILKISQQNMCPCGSKKRFLKCCGTDLAIA